MSESTTEAVVETSDDSTETTAEGTATETSTTEAEQALGDAGKKALDAMKAERKAARDEAAAAKAERDALQAKLDGKEAEHAAEQEKQRIRDDALAVANSRIVNAELRAAAKGKVTDEALGDLSLYINPSDFEVGDDGQVDDGAISRAIDDLIASRPYLAAQGKRFQGTADGGARTDANQPSQLTRADLARMSPEEIAEAHDSGRTADLLTGK